MKEKCHCLLKEASGWLVVHVAVCQPNLTTGQYYLT